MAAELIAQIPLETRDGVPVRWMPEAPQLTGVLMFRVGRADETPVTAGLTHLVEHLALYALGPTLSFEHNGSVDGLRTVFWATGSADEVAGFMNQLCEALAHPPMERLVAECRILRTEAASRASSFAEALKWYRYGTRGPGMSHMTEFALLAPNPDAVLGWARERFCAENAAAWFSGPIPEALDFKALPRGRRIPCPTLEEKGGLHTPAILPIDLGGVGLSVVTRRSDWLNVPMAVAVARLQERMRHREGLIYGVEYEYEPISASRGHATLWAGCLAEHAGALQKGLLEVLDELAANGPTPEELSEVRERYGRFWTSPDSVNGSLDHASAGDLMGYPMPAPAALMEELAGRTRESWAETLRAALETMVLVIPSRREVAPGFHLSRCEVAPGFHLYPLWSREAAAGRRYRAAKRRLPWLPKGPELIVGDEGVSYVNPGGDAITVYYRQCAGAVMHPNGALCLMGEDGFEVWINPAEWRGGVRARDAAARALPAHRLLVITEGQST